MCSKYHDNTQDKTFAFVNQFTESSSSNVVDVTGNESGAMTKFGVALKLGMNPESQEFNIILGEMESEGPEAWDSKDPMERGFMKAGLCKYKFAAKLLTQNRNEDVYSEVVASESASKKMKTSVFSQAALADQSAQVALVDPEWHQMRANIKILSSSEPKIQEQVKNMKQMLAVYKGLPTADANVARQMDLQQHYNLASDFEMEVMGMLAMGGNIAKEDTSYQKAFSVKSKEKIDEVSDFLQAAALACKKSQSYLDSL